MTTLAQHPEHPYINGEFDSSRGAETFQTVNPATEEVLANVVQCDTTHVDDAVAAAASAQKQWWKITPSERGAIMWRFSDLMAQHAGELALLDTQNIGQPLAVSRANVAGAIRSIQYWAGMSDKISGQQLPLVAGNLSYTSREPVGVVAVIIPWNAPISGFAGRSGAALAGGNGVVVKPSEFSPASALRSAQLAVDAGMPVGLLNVVTGDGAVGRALTSHPGVGAVTFTGSVPTGRSINASAAETFKKVTLELGGKSPNIVFADADLEQSVRGAAFAVFQNSGQVCCGGTRLLVQRSIVDQFTERLRDTSSRIRVGDPIDSSVHIGPLVSRAQYQRVTDYVSIGRAEGATVLAGGTRPDTVEGDRGFYLSPTIFTDVTSDMRIAQEEIFGPAVVVIPFDEEHEALTLAADVEYGLAAMVWTSDGSRMLRMADALEVGMVWGNTTIVVHPGLPFGGFRNSGLGNAFGEGALDGVTRLKRTSIRYQPDGAFPHWPESLTRTNRPWRSKSPTFIHF